VSPRGGHWPCGQGQCPSSEPGTWHIHFHRKCDTAGTVTRGRLLLESEGSGPGGQWARRAVAEMKLGRVGLQEGLELESSRGGQRASVR
jgi:hypothetical protein